MINELLKKIFNIIVGICGIITLILPFMYGIIFLFQKDIVNGLACIGFSLAVGQIIEYKEKELERKRQGEGQRNVDIQYNSNIINRDSNKEESKPQNHNQITIKTIIIPFNRNKSTKSKVYSSTKKPNKN